jgi:hypothetical protein
VLAQLAHERLAEATDFSVALALGVEISTALATAHVKASQGILEGLFETKELEAITHSVNRWSRNRLL